jgi:hypothetical protein
MRIADEAKMTRSAIIDSFRIITKSNNLEEKQLKSIIGSYLDAFILHLILSGYHYSDSEIDS